MVCLIFGISFRSQEAAADPTKEFVMSCSYGVLAGTLVGAATLAFTDRPGDNLNKIARGASFGLYAGIALGLYVVFGVPEGEEDLSGAGIVKDESQPKLLESNFQMFPLISANNQLDGGAVQITVLRF